MAPTPSGRQQPLEELSGGKGMEEFGRDGGVDYQSFLVIQTASQYVQDCWFD